MAYSTANLHQLIEAGNRLNVWIYEDTATFATVAGAGFISDAYDRGMAVGDLIIVKQFTTDAMTALSAESIASVTAVSSTVGATLGAAITGGTITLSHSGAADPTVNADSTAGYAAGSTWYNTSTLDLWTCVSASAGAAVWIPSKTKMLLQAGEVSSKGSDAKVVYWRAPFKGKIVTVSGILNAALASADGSVTFAIAGTGVTDGVITLTQAASAAGSKFTATPSALNAFAAGDTITATVGGSSTATATMNLAALIVQTM
jgi:hypothetical protein